MKKNIIFMILGAIIATVLTVGVYAINASNIDYKNNKNVSEALDDLYIEANKDIITRLNLSADKITSSTIGGDKGVKYIDLNLNTGKYLIVGTEAIAMNANNQIASDNTQVYYAQPSTSVGTCTYLWGVGNTSIATVQVSDVSQVLVERSALYICTLTSEGTVRVTTSQMGSSNHENTNLVAHAIKLD